MTCREFIDFLMDYTTGNVTPDEKSVFEEHLSLCPYCVAYLHDYEQTSRLAQSAGRMDVTEVAVPEQLVRAVLAARPPATTDRV